MSARPIATKAELVERLRQREKPKIERALEPNGSTRLAVKASQAAANETRIRAIRESLGSARQKLRDGFAGTSVAVNRKRDMDHGY